MRENLYWLQLWNVLKILVRDLLNINLENLSKLHKIRLSAGVSSWCQLRLARESLRILGEIGLGLFYNVWVVGRRGLGLSLSSSYPTESCEPLSPYLVMILIIPCRIIPSPKAVESQIIPSSKQSWVTQKGFWLASSSSNGALPVDEGVIESLVCNRVQFELLEDQSEGFLGALNFWGYLLEALLLKALLKSLEPLVYAKKVRYQERQSKRESWTYLPDAWNRLFHRPSLSHQGSWRQRRISRWLL